MVFIYSFILLHYDFNTHILIYNMIQDENLDWGKLRILYFFNIIVYYILFFISKNINGIQKMGILKEKII